jgi:hypothetical protein
MACACPAIIRAELPLEEFPRDASPIIDRKADSPTRLESPRLRKFDPDIVGIW